MSRSCIFLFLFAVTIQNGSFDPKPLDHLTINLNVDDSPKGEEEYYMDLNGNINIANSQEEDYFELNDCKMDVYIKEPCYCGTFVRTICKQGTMCVHGVGGAAVKFPIFSLSKTCVHVGGQGSDQSACRKEDNVRYSGKHIAKKQMGGVEECINWCQAYHDGSQKCDYWTFQKSNNNCKLKKGNPYGVNRKRKIDNDYISGLKDCAIEPATTLPASTTTSSITAATPDCIGCFYNQESPKLYENEVNLSSTNTYRNCKFRCISKFPESNYVGLENGYKCYCGTESPFNNAFKRLHPKEEDYWCDENKCTGDTSTTCGGSRHIKVCKI